MEPKYIFYIVILCIIAFVIFYIRECINEKKGIDSEEKQQINDIIQKVVPNAQDFTPAYARWQVTNYTGGGRTSINTTTRYWYYAIAFKTGMIHIIPLSFDGGDISYGESMCFTKENLGMVDSDMWATFYDLEKKEILTLAVYPSNLKGDKYEPVNIQQKEAAEAFKLFIKEFMTEVNTYHNVPVKEKNGRPIKKQI